MDQTDTQRIIALADTALANKVTRDVLCMGNEMTPEYVELVKRQRVEIQHDGHAIMVTFNFEEAAVITVAPENVTEIVQGATLGWSRHLSLICRTAPPPMGLLQHIMDLVGFEKPPAPTPMGRQYDGVIDVLQIMTKLPGTIVN